MRKPHQMETDERYDVAVARPAYTSGHPSVLFDEADHNFHTPATRYKPFAELIRNDGYRIESTLGHSRPPRSPDTTYS